MTGRPHLRRVSRGRTSLALLVTALATGCGSTVAGSSAPPTGADHQQSLSLPSATATAGSAGGPGVAAGGQPGGSQLAGPNAVATAGSNGVPRQPTSTAPTTATVTGPIRIGFLSLNNDAAASAGVKNGNSFQEQQVFQALVAADNRRGGIDGRHIDATYAQINSSSTNYPSDLQAACDSFTQDHHVAVVISAVGLWSNQLATCLAKARVPQIEGSYAVGDNSELTQVPSLLAPTSLSTNQRVAAVLRELRSTGYLSPHTRLGVVVEGCPDNERAYHATFVPLAQRLGIPLVSEATSECFQGVNGFGTLASDMQNAALKFKTENVQRVAFISSVEGDLLLLFSGAATSENYHPGYALDSLALPVVAESNMPPDQIRNFHGLGWLPVVDVNAAASSRTPTQTQCLSTLHNGGGPTPSGAEDYYFAYIGCDTLSLLERALQLGGGAMPASDVRNVAQQLGSSFRTAVTYGGQSDFSNRPGAAAAGREFAWGAGCSCFTYTGPVVQIARIDH
jgi:hypothetical protein